MKKIYLLTLLLSTFLCANKITNEVEIAIIKSIDLENKKAPVNVTNNLTFLKAEYSKKTKTQTIYYEVKDELKGYSDELIELYAEDLRNDAQIENCNDKRVVDFYGKWEDLKLAYNYTSQNKQLDTTVIIDFKKCKD
jgi:hypothetical protein